MRFSALPFLLVAAGFCLSRPAAAQLDEKPPVLRRGDPSNPTGSPTGIGKDKKSSDSAENPEELVRATGVVQRMSAKAIEIAADDSRILLCKITSATVFSGPEGKLTADDIDAGMHVRVRAKTDSDARELLALEISIENFTAKPTDQKTATIQSATDDEDRPVLRRGVPAKRAKSDDDADDDTPIVATLKPPPQPSQPSSTGSEHDDDAPAAKRQASPSLLDKARESNESFSERLPNFVCQQFTTRYDRQSRGTGWQATDVVSATVVYNDGTESYQNIKVGNKAVNKDMMDLKGQISVGEFGSVLHSLFTHTTNADFRYLKDEEIRRQSAKVYEFTVKRENADWQILSSGQSIVPAYSGRIWISKENGRVLRIERQADAIPEAFPLDALEQSIDYAFVSIGTHKLLLPSESDNLSCQRGSSFCAKNVIEFRNYREFQGEATIEFDK